jgi:hypothetical protein
MIARLLIRVCVVVIIGGLIQIAYILIASVVGTGQQYTLGQVMAVSTLSALAGYVFARAIDATRGHRRR